VAFSVTHHVHRKRGRYILTYDVDGELHDFFLWVFFEGIRTGLLEHVIECPQCARFILRKRKSGKYCSDACRKAAHAQRPAPLSSAQRQQRYRVKNFGRR